MMFIMVLNFLLILFINQIRHFVSCKRVEFWLYKVSVTEGQDKLKVLECINVEESLKLNKIDSFVAS